MADPFAAMTRQLTGTAARPPTPAEATADRFGRAAEALRETGDPELQAMADGIEAWLRAGGDLARLIGAKARPGRRNDLPRNHLRRQALAAELRALVADDAGQVHDHREAGKVLVAVLRRLPMLVSVIRESTGVDRVPTSEKALIGLIRGTEP